MALSDDDKEWILAQLERAETELLTAFQKWASPLEMRQGTHTSTLRAVGAEMEAIQDRVSTLEERTKNL